MVNLINTNTNKTKQQRGACVTEKSTDRQRYVQQGFGTDTKRSLSPTVTTRKADKNEIKSEKTAHV